MGSKMYETSSVKEPKATTGDSWSLSKETALSLVLCF